MTWTGDGTNDRVLSHSLGIQPGMVIVKRATGGTENWPVWHRSVSSGSAGNLFLNLTNSLGGAKIRDASATTFTLGTSDTSHNAVGSTYVAYVFAHDPSANGIIQAGSFTGNGLTNGPEVNLGWEPQYLMVKRATGAAVDNWQIYDVMRGISTGGIDSKLMPNLSSAESSGSNDLDLNSTGFKIVSTNSSLNANSDTYIYLAIRK